MGNMCTDRWVGGCMRCVGYMQGADQAARGAGPLMHRWGNVAAAAPPGGWRLVRQIERRCVGGAAGRPTPATEAVPGVRPPVKAVVAPCPVSLPRAG